MLALGSLILTLSAIPTAIEGPKGSSRAESVASSGGQAASDPAFFAAKVLPVLRARCFSCHSQESGKKRGGLHLDTRAALLKGGGEGPAIVPGDAQGSALIAAIEYRDPDAGMPPDEALPAGEIEILRQWVAGGAAWPSGAQVSKRHEKVITDEDRAWWAFAPVGNPRIPEVTGKRRVAANPIDAFVASGLAPTKLAPAPETDRRTFIRRLSFDLHGLPPAPAEVDAFVRDRAPRAHERLVDRLLASPRYGERWARKWLDLVRFAESDGYRQDAYRANAWPYRDYVIRSFNADKPYDQFVLEQLAGDELAPGDPEIMTATGYLRLGRYEWNQRDVRTQWTQVVDEVTDVTGDAFMGLGLQCARCHDHKFDPILQRDYYRLRAFFAPMVWRDDVHVANVADQLNHKQKLAAWEASSTALREAIAEIERPYLERRELGSIKLFPPDVHEILKRGLPAWPDSVFYRPDTDTRVLQPDEWQLFRLAWRQVKHDGIDGSIKGEAREGWSQLKHKLGELGPRPTMPAGSFVVTDVGPEAPITFIPDDREKRPIAPGFPSVIDPGDATIAPTDEALSSTGRRTALARWIGNPGNALTMRVFVNRIWQRLMGRGLVNTTSDFGHLGEKPTHPELLDWLTRKFIDGGMRIKPIERLILTSATYRQGTHHKDEAQARKVDPENRLLWHQAVRRLDAEEVRDTLLWASGELDLTAGGASVDPATPRRAIYTTQLRNQPDPLLAAFDVVDGNASTPSRNVTTTASQALFLLNSRWAQMRAQTFAARALGGARSDRQRIDQAFRLVFGRPASSNETQSLLGFLRSSASASAGGDVADQDTVVEKMPLRGGTALRVRPEMMSDRWEAASPPVKNSTVSLEAVVMLDSVDGGQEERVMASIEPTDPTGTGFMMGVTGAEDSRGARNLFVRVRRAHSETTYKVASDLIIELHRPYYVAVTMAPPAGNQRKWGVQFYVKDLSDPEAQLKEARVEESMNVGAPWGGTVLVGGTRQGKGWAGLIDEIRLSTTLDRNELMVADSPKTPPRVVGYASFEPDNVKAEGLPQGSILTPASRSTGVVAPPGWVDLCHALLNANELLFLE